MRPRSADYIVGLDIGSSKVACFIAEVSENYTPRVIGYGTHASTGIKSGMVVGMDDTEHAIREAVHMAEEMAGVQVQSVYVSLSGVHIDSHSTDGLVVLGSHEIADSDLDKVIDVACAKQLDGDRQIIHALATRYLLDDQTEIRDPRGMIGARLAANVHIVSAAKAAVRNIVRCVEKCNLEVEEVAVSPLASAMATLVPDERELGVALVDIGGGTCDIAIYEEDSLVHTAVIPLGGQHITSDIARGLSTPMQHAERIKSLYGCALARALESDDNIDIPHVGEDEETMTGHITRGQLAGIIQPRCEEILEMVRERIEKSGFENAVGRRVVLTGGTSQLSGMRQLAEMVLDKSVRIAKPTGVEGLTSMSGIPSFATASGLLIYGLQRQVQHRRMRRKVSVPGTGMFASVSRWMKESFQVS